MTDETEEQQVQDLPVATKGPYKRPPQALIIWGPNGIEVKCWDTDMVPLVQLDKAAMIMPRRVLEERRKASAKKAIKREAGYDNSHEQPKEEKVANG